MGKMTKIVMACLMLACSWLGFSPSASPSTAEIGLEFKGQMMSAELEGVSLRLVLEEIESEKGIWFKGDESVLDEKVSIRFKNLPLHVGLRRILSTINHVLVFDEKEGLVGLFIIGKKNTARRTSRDAATVAGKPLPPRPAKEDTARKDPFAPFPHAAPLDNSREKCSERTAEISDMPSVPGNPFGENATSSAENPFAESVTSSSDNPFDGHEAPPSGDPFVDPLGLFRESPKGRD